MRLRSTSSLKMKVSNKKLKRIAGFSQVHYYGVEGDFNIMVIDILGPNLEHMFEYCNRVFSLKTILMLAM